MLKSNIHKNIDKYNSSKTNILKQFMCALWISLLFGDFKHIHSVILVHGCIGKISFLILGIHQCCGNYFLKVFNILPK